MAIDTETMQLIERVVARAIANATSLKGASDEIAKGVTQYVGARYVPLFAEPLEWDKTKAYEPLTIVLYQGNSYTSRQYVPVGVELTNESFWAETGNYNAQVEQYRQEVKTFDGRITANANAIETETTNRAEAVSAEMKRAEGAEQTLNENLTNEIERATKSENVLKSLYADSVSDMITKDLTVGSTVNTLGFYEKGDKGGCQYVIKDTGVEDGATVFKLKNNNKAVLIGTPNLYGIGCKPSEPSLNVKQFNAAMKNIDTIVIPNGNFEFNDTIHLSKNCHITGMGINSIVKNVGASVLFSVDGKISHPQLDNFRIDLADGIGSGIYLENPYDDCFIKNIFVDNCRSYAVKVGYDGSDISQTLQMDNIIIYTSSVGEIVSDLMILDNLQEFTLTNSKFLVRNKTLNKYSNLVMNESNNSFIAGNSFTGCDTKPCVSIGKRLAYNQRFIGNWFENNEAAPIDMQLPNLGNASSQSYFIGNCFYYNAVSEAIFKDAGTVTIIGGMKVNSDIGNSRIILDNTSELYSKTGMWKSVTNGNDKMISNIMFSALFNEKGFGIFHNANESVDYGLTIKYNEEQLFTIGTDGSFSKLCLHSDNGTKWYLKVSNTGELSAEHV